MKFIQRTLSLSLMFIILLCSIASAVFCSNCGASGSGNFCSICGSRLAGGDSSFYDPDAPHDMGIPQLNGAVYRQDAMNMVVFWVQTQLKATGIYYQGDIWDVTGSLGDETMRQIKSFMNARGYRNHNGTINQTVIDELAAYLNYNTVPVYVGGYYDKMNSIMRGGSTGSMDKIVCNLRDNIPHVTTGARWVQICLSNLGYYNSTIDGKYGEGTDRAIRAFQSAYGFQERDYVTLGVARAMIEACYQQGCLPYNLP